MTTTNDNSIYIPHGGGCYCGCVGIRSVRMHANYYQSKRVVRITTRLDGCDPHLRVHIRQASSIDDAQHAVEKHFDRCVEGLMEEQLEEILALFGGEVPPPVETEKEDDQIVFSYIKVYDDGTTIVLRRYFDDEGHEDRAPKVIIALPGEGADIDEYIEFRAPGARMLRWDVGIID